MGKCIYFHKIRGEDDGIKCDKGHNLLTCSGPNPCNDCRDKYVSKAVKRVPKTQTRLF